MIKNIIQSGDVINHQDQLITLVNFNVKKIKNSKFGNVIVLFVRRLNRLFYASFRRWFW